MNCSVSASPGSWTKKNWLCHPLRLFMEVSIIPGTKHVTFEIRVATAYGIASASPRSWNKKKLAITSPSSSTTNWWWTVQLAPVLGPDSMNKKKLAVPSTEQQFMAVSMIPGTKHVTFEIQFATSQYCMRHSWLTKIWGYMLEPARYELFFCRSVSLQQQ